MYSSYRKVKQDKLNFSWTPQVCQVYLYLRIQCSTTHNTSFHAEFNALPGCAILLQRMDLGNIKRRKKRFPPTYFIAIDEVCQV